MWQKTMKLVEETMPQNLQDTMGMNGHEWFQYYFKRGYNKSKNRQMILY